MLLRPVTPEKKRFENRMKNLNRLVLAGVFLFMPIYLYMRFTGGSQEKLHELPELLDRLKQPIVWEVPEDGVKYLHFFRGRPQEGHKFVLVRLRMEARMKMGFPVVPRCFKLVDDQQVRHFPLSRSPLFITYTDEIYLDRGTVLEGELLFEIPAQRHSVNLLFARYQE